MAAQYEHELSQRIADLESQLAFQEDTIGTLNQLVTQQADELQRLQRSMQLVLKKFQQLDTNDGATSSDPAQEIPPHY